MASDAPPVDPAPDDPWDWSLEHLIQEFCAADRPQWCGPNDRLPDRQSLEKLLRDNEFNAELILTYFTHATLRDEFGVKVVGHRHAILKGVNFLRLISQKYQKTLRFQATPSKSLQTQVKELPANSEPHTKAGPGLARSASSALPPAPFNPVLALSPDPKPHKEGEKKKQRRLAPVLVVDPQDVVQDPIFVDEEAESQPGYLFVIGNAASTGKRKSVYRKLFRYLQGSKLISEELFKAEKDHPVNTGEDELDDLLARYPPLPEDQDIAVDIEDSEEIDFDEETRLEIEKDKAEDAALRDRADNSLQALTRAQVNAVVDDCVAKYKEMWATKRLPLTQAKGYRLWKKASQAGSIQTELASARYWIERKAWSIGRLRANIVEQIWAKEPALRKQCEIMEETINQQEEHEYMVDVLSKRVAPPRPKQASVQRVRHPRPSQPADDDISLDSESDVSMSNFIVDDEIIDKVRGGNTGQGETVSDNMVPDLGEVAGLNEAPVIDKADASTEVADEIMEDAPPISKPAAATPQKISDLAVANPKTPLTPSSAKPKSTLLGIPTPQRKMPLYHSSSSSSEIKVVHLSGTRIRINLPEVGHNKSTAIMISSSDTSPVDKDTSLSQSADLVASQITSPITLSLRPPKTLDLQAYTQEAISSISWEDIQQESDHRRALAKRFYALDKNQLDTLRCYGTPWPVSQMLEYLDLNLACLALKTPGGGCQHGQFLSILFASYSLARRVDLDADEKVLEKARKHVKSGVVGFWDAFKDLMSKNSPAPAETLKRKKSESALSLSGREADLEASSESDIKRLQRTSGGKRRRVIPQTAKSKSSQAAGQERSQKMKEVFASPGGRLRGAPTNEANTYPIGILTPVVELDPQIGKRAKEHQIAGIRFMWREIITDELQQGCLLAHTMGLGKTMQVISLLVTIAQCSKSEKPAIRDQIPVDLQHLKALIICPPSLIENWHAEIILWQPDQSLGEVFPITHKQMDGRLKSINKWAEQGGILIMSYDMLRGLIVNKGKSGKNDLVSTKLLTDEQHELVEQQLLEQANIIVADEAHMLKNPKAKISLVAARFHSKRRIALTGSPLANNLDEYYETINWVAPDYLGTRDVFRARFGNPIADGLWQDSSSVARRVSLRRLTVLQRNIDPKIDRADITAIANELPSKTEFFITVSLTPLQIQAYNLSVDLLVPGMKRTSLFDYLGLLTLLVNHPSTFLQKLEERQNGTENTRKRPRPSISNDVTTEDEDGDGDVVPAEEVNLDGLSSDVIDQIRALFEHVQEMQDPGLSHRTQLTHGIIERSVAAGDKVLLFSHSIPALNYLENMLTVAGLSVRRLDGATNMNKRQGMVNEFNESAEHNVFLISTRAGGLGLNLQGANRVIIFDYSFNPIWEQQAIGRAYRLGQQKPVYVYRFRAGGTYEDVIFNTSVFKTQLAGRVVDKKSTVRYAKKNARDYLFNVRTVDQQDHAHMSGKDAVMDQVLASWNVIRSIELTETFQREEVESLTKEEADQAEAELKAEQDFRSDPGGFARRQREKAQPQPSKIPPRVLPSFVSAAGPSTQPSALPRTPTTAAHPPHASMRIVNSAPRPANYGMNDASNGLPGNAPSGRDMQFPNMSHPPRFASSQTMRPAPLPSPSTPPHPQQPGSRPNFISRPEAARSGHQAETYPWDQPQNFTMVGMASPSLGRSSNANVGDRSSRPMARSAPGPSQPSNDQVDGGGSSPADPSTRRNGQSSTSNGNLDKDNPDCYPQ